MPERMFRKGQAIQAMIDQFRKPCFELAWFHKGLTEYRTGSSIPTAKLETRMTVYSGLNGRP